jgi:signal transduction histidine kinase
MQRSPIIILFLFIFLLPFVCCQKEAKTIGNNFSSSAKIQLGVKLSTSADTYFSTAKFDSAFLKYHQATEIFKEEKDSVYTTYTLIKIAKIQQIFGDYSSCEETLTEALNYTKKDSDYLFSIHNLLGITSKELKNFEDAIAYYKIMLRTVKDPILKFTARNNIAAVYIEQAKYSEAIQLLEPYSQTNILDSYPKKEAILMDNLGFAYSKKGAVKKGLDLMNKALAIRIQTDDSYGSIASYLHLADYYQHIDSQKSNKNAVLAYQKATQTKSIDEQLQALSFLMLNNPQKGMNHYAQSFVKLNDSIKKVRNNAKNQFAKIKYDASKATLENIKYKEERTAIALQLQTKKNQTYLFGFGVLLLLITIAFLINYFKNKNKQERLQASYSTETRISKKLHDELANDVFYAMTFAGTQDLQNPIMKETLLDNLDQIYKRTRNISKENSPIDTGENFAFNLKQMLNSYKSNTVEVILKTQNPIDWLQIEDHKKIAIQRVLQELMVNMKKYSQASFVVIGFDSNQNSLLIDYSDNGIGFSEKLILKNGLQNAENRILAINGLLTFDSQTHKGFKAKIIIPK